MNSSLVTADVATHLKIITVALLAVILVMWIAISTRLTFDRDTRPSSRVEQSSPAPALARAAPPTRSSRSVAM
jgi:hypothetical protein